MYVIVRDKGNYSDRRVNVVVPMFSIQTTLELARKCFEEEMATVINHRAQWDYELQKDTEQHIEHYQKSIELVNDKSVLDKYYEVGLIAVFRTPRDSGEYYMFDDVSYKVYHRQIDEWETVLRQLLEDYL